MLIDGIMKMVETHNLILDQVNIKTSERIIQMMQHITSTCAYLSSIEHIELACHCMTQNGPNH